MTQYYLSEAGRMPVRLIGTKAECRRQVREIAREALASARRRYGRAFLHKFDDNYEITLARDRRSAMWTSLGLVESK